MHYSQRNCNKSHKNQWIKKVIKEGDKIVMEILEIVNEETWPEKEREWIQKYNNLTNISIGGKGGSNKKYKVLYEEMKDSISKYNIQSKSEFIKFTKTKEYPNNLPKSPDRYFKDKWISWGDFLGTDRSQDNKVSEIYISYDECKSYIQSLNTKIRSKVEWRKIDIPHFIPKRPERFYKNRGWISWSDFLGKKRIANQYRKVLSYEEAKSIMIDLNIKTLNQYNKIQKEMYINELPVHPHLTYKNKGFINYDEFFSRF
jgi:hypothetical protein